ncbi:Target of rapamycin complex 1 subunit kog1 [Massospora cicadina]|nr:Target of rapamycin complex 1 subunit kog1 [Massospora cicadina]
MATTVGMVEGPSEAQICAEIRHGLGDDEAQICTEIRHGLGDELNLEDPAPFIDPLERVYFTGSRHSGLQVEPFLIPAGEDIYETLLDWRLRDRQKTVTVALCLCLNFGTEPPDVVRASPCPKLLSWIDPNAFAGPKALEEVGRALQQQYEVLQPRARYKALLDPTVEEAKKICCSLRRSSKDERILFHYNGHGVPKPTTTGELWVFNKTYTQYVPLPIHELQAWLGAPCMMLYDCPAAENIVRAFYKAAQDREVVAERAGDGVHGSYAQLKDAIQFAACGADEILPLNPELPADVFTSCMTTPIEMALRWFVLKNPLLPKLDVETILKLPGRFNDRSTPLGNLCWVFTSITDTIAWTVLPPMLFKQLFRQDLMVAALFRNFLLADRIMRSLKCHPVSVPALPNTHNHPLWKSWDLAVDLCLSQLPDLIAYKEGGPIVEYRNSPFFADQLTAFEIWLSHGAVKRAVPEQLPIVLQVLLSQAHRARALRLLGQFLDLGLWAVNAALLVGIFPYILKLLQSPAAELKPLLTFIWARLIPVDPSCQNDLLKDNGFLYFVELLNADRGHSLANLSEHRGIAAFILAFFCKDFNHGKKSCLQHGLLNIALPHLGDPNPFLRQWTCLMLAQLWRGFPDAKVAAFGAFYHDRLLRLVQDKVPEVRAAALFGLSSLIECDTEAADHLERDLALALMCHSLDASPMVRQEWAVYMSQFVFRHRAKFVAAAKELLEAEHVTITRKGPIVYAAGLSSRQNSTSSLRHLPDSTARPKGQDPSHATEDPNRIVYALLWKTLLNATHDPFPRVARTARRVTDNVHRLLLKQHFLQNGSTPPALPLQAPRSPSQSPLFNSRINLTSTLRRSASFTLKTLNPFATPHEPASPATLPTEPDEGAPQMDFGIATESRYFDWCCNRFQEPQMKPPESEEPGSRAYQQREWRHQRNARQILETSPHASVLRTWTTERAAFANDFQPLALAFHRYEPHLVVADEKGYLSVWNWEREQPILRFHVPIAPSVSITTLKLINEADEAILAVAASDGGVRLYRHYWENALLASAFRAVTEIPVRRKAPPPPTRVVLEWQQPHGVFLVGGGTSVIKVWDAVSERCVADIPTRSTSGVTALTSDPLAGHFLVAGFQDGSVRAYDRRLPPRENMARCWREHHSTLVGAHLQEGSVRELVSASSAGEVKLWDIRATKSVGGFTCGGTITAFALHDQAPLVASGTPQSGISIYTTRGKCLGTTHHYQGAPGLLLGQRVATVNTLAFHPRRMVAAAASGGGVVGGTGEKSSNVTLISWDAPVMDHPDGSDLAAHPASGGAPFDLSSVRFFGATLPKLAPAPGSELAGRIDRRSKGREATLTSPFKNYDLM